MEFRSLNHGWMLHEIKQGIQATAVDEAGTAVKGAPTKERKRHNKLVGGG